MELCYLAANASLNVGRNLIRADLGGSSDTQPHRALLRRLQNHAPEVKAPYQPGLYPPAAQDHPGSNTYQQPTMKAAVKPRMS